MNVLFFKSEVHGLCFIRCNVLEQSGDVAKHLELVSHGVRTRLDELKRQEIGRIRDLVREQQKQQGKN